MKRDEETGDTSIFNMGIATTIRIDSILKQMTFCNTNKILKGHSLTPTYQNLLLELYKESNPFINNTNKNKEGKTDLQIAEDYILQMDEHPIQYRQKTIIVPNELNKIMFSFEIWLRRILYKEGLLMPKETSDPSKAIMD